MKIFGFLVLTSALATFIVLGFYSFFNIEVESFESISDLIALLWLSLMGATAYVYERLTAERKL